MTENEGEKSNCGYLVDSAKKKKMLFKTRNTISNNNIKKKKKNKGIVFQGQPPSDSCLSGNRQVSQEKQFEVMQ